MKWQFGLFAISFHVSFHHSICIIVFRHFFPFIFFVSLFCCFLLLILFSLNFVGMWYMCNDYILSNLSLLLRNNLFTRNSRITQPNLQHCSVFTLLSCGYNNTLLPKVLMLYCTFCQPSNQKPYQEYTENKICIQRHKWRNNWSYY